MGDGGNERARPQALQEWARSGLWNSVGARPGLVAGVNTSSSHTAVGFQILAAEQDLGVWRRSGLPGEEEEAAAPGQRVCPGLATEPGPGLGSVCRCPEGFRP